LSQNKNEVCVDKDTEEWMEEDEYCYLVKKLMFSLKKLTEKIILVDRDIFRGSKRNEKIS
jgi:hypothetical protein